MESKVDDAKLEKYMSLLKKNIRNRIKEKMKKYECQSDEDDIANMGDGLHFSSVSTVSAKTLKRPKQISHQNFSMKYINYKNGLTTPRNRKTNKPQIEMNPDDLFAIFDDDFSQVSETRRTFQSKIPHVRNSTLKTSVDEEVMRARSVSQTPRKNRKKWLKYF